MAARGTALLFGATGFVGGALRRELSEHGWSVIGTSRREGTADRVVDLVEYRAVEETLAALRPELIVNAAGYPSVASSWAEPDASLAANSTAVSHLLEAIRAVYGSGPGDLPYLLTLSSAAVLARPAGGQALTERSPVGPVSPYGAAKAVAELTCELYRDVLGVPIGVARIFNQVGPGQSVEQAPSEFSAAIVAAERAGQTELLLPVGDPGTARDFTDVRDTAKACAVMAAERLDGLVNLCSGRPARLETVVELLGRHTEVAVEIETSPDKLRGTESSVIYGSHDLLSERTGWQPGIALEQSLADLLEDWRRRPPA